MEIDKSLTLIQSVKSLIDKELPLVSNLANLSRLFFEYFKTRGMGACDKSPYFFRKNVCGLKKIATFVVKNFYCCRCFRNGKVRVVVGPPFFVYYA